MGEVIGVNSSIYSPSGGSVGLGFAIPIDRTKRIVEDCSNMVRSGSRGWDCVSKRHQVQAHARPPVPGPLSVAWCPAPAERAGVRIGDQIVRAGSRTVRNPFDWEARLLDVRVGESVPIVLKRGAREVTVTVVVSDAPEVNAPKVTVLRELQLITLTDVLRQERGIAVSAGALVYKVSERISDQIGLQAGDVIVQVGRSRIGSAEAASSAIERDGSRGAVVLVFERGRQLLQTSFVLR
jgi:serine protease Do